MRGHRFCGVSTTPRGRGLLLHDYSLAKSHFNGWGFVKAWMAVFSVPKYLDQVKKIPSVTVNNVET